MLKGILTVVIIYAFWAAWDFIGKPLWHLFDKAVDSLVLKVTKKG